MVPLIHQNNVMTGAQSLGMDAHQHANRRLITIVQDIQALAIFISVETEQKRLLLSNVMTLIQGRATDAIKLVS